MNTLSISSATSIVLNNAQTTMAGWSWDGAALRHTTRTFLVFSAEKSAEITAACAAATPSAYEELTGAQVAALPEADRAAYTYEGCANDITGIYAKLTPGTRPEVDFAKDDVLEQGRR